MGKLLQSPLLTAPLVLLAGFLLLNIIEISPEKSDLDSRVANLDRERARTEADIRDIEERAEYLRSSAYQEIQARLRLDYKKPGERVIFVYERAPDNESGNSGTASSSLSFWEKLKRWFFGD